MKSITAVCLVFTGIIAAGTPTLSLAQPPENKSGAKEEVVNKKIDLDAESATLYSSLKLLFSQVKANFTIDDSAKSLNVSAHFSQVPFHIALDTLLKSSGASLTYRIEDGIYNIVKKVEAPAEPEGSSGGAAFQDNNAVYVSSLQSIHITNLSAIDIVQALGGIYINLPYVPGTRSGTGTGGPAQGGISGGTGNSGASNGNGNGNNGNPFSGGGRPNSPLLSDLTDITAIFATNGSNNVFVQYGRK